MDELSQALAMLGRKQLALENLHDSYNKLLEQMDRVAKGEVNPEWITVDLFGRSWKIDIPAPTVVQPEPATVADVAPEVAVQQ